MVKRTIQEWSDEEILQLVSPQSQILLQTFADLQKPLILTEEVFHNGCRRILEQSVGKTREEQSTLMKEILNVSLERAEELWSNIGANALPYLQRILALAEPTTKSLDAAFLKKSLEDVKGTKFSHLKDIWLEVARLTTKEHWEIVLREALIQKRKADKGLPTDKAMGSWYCETACAIGGAATGYAITAATAGWGIAAGVATGTLAYATLSGKFCT